MYKKISITYTLISIGCIGQLDLTTRSNKWNGQLSHRLEEYTVGTVCRCRGTVFPHQTILPPVCYRFPLAKTPPTSENSVG